MSRTVNLTARAAARYQPGFSAYNLNATQFHSGQSAPRRAPFTVPTPIRLNLSKPAGPRNHGSFGSVEIALCLHAKTNSYPSKFVQKVPATVGSWDHYLWRGDSLDELFGIKCTWKDFGIVTPGGEEKKLLFLLKPFDSNQHRLLNAVMYGCRLRLIDFTIELKPTPVTSRPVGVMRVRIGSHPFIVERWEKLEGNLFSIEKHDELVNTLRELATVLPSTPTRVQQMLNRPPRFNLLKVLKPDGPAIDWSWIERADDEGFKLPDTFLESLSPLHKAYWKLRQIRPDLVVLVEQGQSVSLYHDQTSFASALGIAVATTHRDSLKYAPVPVWRAAELQTVLKLHFGVASCVLDLDEGSWIDVDYSEVARDDEPMQDEDEDAQEERLEEFDSYPVPWRSDMEALAVEEEREVKEAQEAQMEEG